MPELELYRPRRVSRIRHAWQSLRAFTIGPINLKDPALARHFGGSPVSSGVAVNEQSSMNYSAVWAAVNLIASDIGKVPLLLYKTDDRGAKERFKRHPLYRLLHDRPNPHMGSLIFRRTLQAHAMVWGNGYAEIERDGGGRPAALWPLMPYAVEPLYENGTLRYRVHNPTKAATLFDAKDIVHIRGLGDDGIVGYSVIQKARESIGLGIAAERFGSTFFGNGSTFGGVISWPQGVNPHSTEAAKKGFREAIEVQHQGVDKAHRFLALYEGAKYERLGIPPNDAQFLETRQFQIEEICRWFNVPPHKLKHLLRSTNNNIEHQGIEYVVDTLDPWWVIWEEELELKLVSPLEREQQKIKHLRDALLRGDSQARGEFYSKLFSIASITPNEVREREDLNPVAGGDTVYVPLNTLPLDRLDEYITATIEAKKPAPVAQPQPDDDDGEDDDEETARQIATLTEERDHARRKAQEAEDVADRAKADQVELRAELARAIVGADVLRSDVTDARQALAEVTAERNDWREQTSGTLHNLQAMTAERDAALAEVALGIAATDVLRAEAAALAVRCDEASAARDGWRAQVEDVTQRLHTMTAERDHAREELTGVRASLQVADSALVVAEREGTQARAELSTARSDYQTRLDALRQELATVSQQVAAAGEQIQAGDVVRAALDADLARARTLLGELQASAAAAIGQRDRYSDDIVALRASLDEMTAAREEAAAGERTRRAVLLTALRGLFVDATNRILQREADRIVKQKAATTPDKLRAWADTFYGLHPEFCRVAFRPAVRVWSALTGSEAEPLLERLVTAHVTQSQTALVAVAEELDGDLRAAAIDRLLRRWESERAETMADALLREGMAEHG